jgi:hypothetical protein
MICYHDLEQECKASEASDLALIHLLSLVETTRKKRQRQKTGPWSTLAC